MDIEVPGLGIVAIAGDTPTPEEEAAIIQGYNEKWDIPEGVKVYGKMAPPIIGGASGPYDFDIGQANSMENIRFGGKMMAALTIPRSIQGKGDAIKKVAPDAKFELGPDGQVRVEVGDNAFILNKPGMSGQDVADVGVEELFQAPLIMTGIGAGGKLLGTAGRVIGAMAGAGTGSAARDIVGGDKIDPVMAAVSAGTAGVFEAIGPLLVRALRNATTQSKYIKNGQLTKQGRAYLQNAGINPDSVTDDFVKQFNRVVNEAEDTVEAARIAEAQSLPNPVPLSRGDVTRSVQDQALESAAERGALGESASRQATGFRATQQAALKQNVDTIASTVGTPGGVEMARDALIAQRDALKASVDAAYQSARQMGASINAEGATALRNALRDGLSSFSKAGAKQVFEKVDELKQLVNTGKATPKTFSIKAFEGWRSQMSSLARSSDPVVRGAAGRALKVYDDFMDDIIEQGLMNGDEAALSTFKDARGLRKELAQKFETDKITKTLVEDDTLAVDPRQASNLLFTASGLGAKKQTASALKQMKSLLGVASPEWRALKQEAFLRLFESQIKGARMADESVKFSGTKFASQFDTAMQKAGAAMKELFSEQDMALINQFKRVALRAGDDSARVPGAVNFSNSGVLVSLLDNMGFLGRSARLVVKKFIESNDDAALRAAFSRPLGSPSRAPVATAAPSVALPTGQNETVREAIGK